MKKDKVLDRPVFNSKDPEIENVGIMQGFLDMLVDDEPEEKEIKENLGRAPNTPEILMNNLRGDMRSVDARREELADLVGYGAAMETPDEVLILLQDKLAKEGIGGLPQQPMPPQGMPPQGMPPMPPQGMPPMPPQGQGGIGSLPMDQGPRPINMREGGIVQNFSSGGTALIPQSDPLYNIYKLAQEPISSKDIATERANLANLIPPQDDTIKNLILAQGFAKFGKTGDFLGTAQELTPAFAQLAQQKATREQKLGELAYSSALAKRKGVTDLLSNIATRENFELIPKSDSIYQQFDPSVSKYGLQRNKLTGEIKPIITPPSTVIGGESELQKQVIKEVPDLLQEVQTIQSDLSRLDESMAVLKENPELVGDGQAIIGMIPYFGQSMQDLALLAEDKFGGSDRGRKAIALQNNILSVINRSMKALLGAQFTEREGERIIKASFNRALSPEQVLTELARLRLSLQTGLDFKLGQLKILSDKDINPLDMAKKIMEINKRVQDQFVKDLNVPVSSPSKSGGSNFGKETEDVDKIISGETRT
jgi:hypothetical protein